MHVYRWDLDKTYLDTDIHSVRGLVRAALETASEKRNVPGSAALARALARADSAARIEIVSGSPTQMRSVLEAKLALDGVAFERLALKDNLGNLRRGRLRAVTGQVGYKLPQLLAMRVGLGVGVHETCFGDDAEVDALVYTAYAEAIAGRLSEAELGRVMEAGGAYPDAVRAALGALRRVHPADAVEDIFIHVGRGVPLATFHLLGPRVVPIFSWFQASVLLWTRGRLSAEGVADVARTASEEASFDEAQLVAHTQDLVRRGRVSPEQVRALFAADPAFETSRGALEEALAWLPPMRLPDMPARPDLLGFLREREAR